MPYPVGYTKNEKDFIESVVARAPAMRQHFDECTNTYPPLRRYQLAVKATQTGPALWHEIGIPAARCQSYAALAGKMAQLAFLHPHDEAELDETLALIRVYHMPELITGDLSGAGLTAEEEARIRKLAMRLMLDGHDNRDDHASWMSTTISADRDARWVRDLHRLALAAQALDYQRTDPHLHARLATLVTTLHTEMETEHAREIAAAQTGQPYTRPPSNEPDYD